MKPRENIYDRLGAELEKTGRSENAVLNLGDTVRVLRLQQKLPAVELCRRAGDLDPKTLNALEKGRIRNPSIRTLQSIARGLGITVSDLFGRAEESDEHLFYQGTQKGYCQIDFPAWGVRVVPFTPLVRDFFCGKMIFGPRKKLEKAQLKHPRPLYVSLLVGRLEVTVEERRVLLKEGENLFFHGNLRHGFYNPLEREAVLLFMTAPSFL